MRRLRHWAMATTVCAGVSLPADLGQIALLPPLAATAMLLAERPAMPQLVVEDFGVLGEDIEQLVQAVKDYVLQINQYIEQIDQYTLQIRQFATEVEQYLQIVYMALNFIHAPNIGTLMGLLNAAGINVNLPLNPYVVMSLVNGYSGGGGGGMAGIISQLTGSLSSLGSLTATTHGNDSLFSCTANSFVCGTMNSNSWGTSGVKGALTNLVQDTQNHLNALTTARTTLSAASDPKTVQDVTAEMAIEQAQIMGNAVQVGAISGLAAVQEKVVRDQAEEKLQADGAAFKAACPSC